MYYEFVFRLSGACLSTYCKLSSFILVPRGRDPSGQHQGSRMVVVKEKLTKNTGSFRHSKSNQKQHQKLVLRSFKFIFLPVVFTSCLQGNVGFSKKFIEQTSALMDKI